MIRAICFLLVASAACVIPPESSFAQGSNIEEADTYVPTPPRKDIIIQARPNPRVAYNNSYALVINVTKYKSDSWPSLPESTVDEADSLRKALVNQGFTVFRARDITGEAILNEIMFFIAQYGMPHSRLLIYFTGHGWTDQAHLEGYLVGSDAVNPSIDPVKFRQGAVSTEQLLMLARASKALHTLFVFDACFSGAVFQTKSIFGLPSNLRVIDILRSGQQFITSSSEFEKSPAISTFTPALIDGVSGKADLNKDGIVLASELASYLKDRVTSSHTPTTPQYGDVYARGGDFAFVYGTIGGPLKYDTKDAGLASFVSIDVEYYRKAADGADLLNALGKERIPYVTTRASLPQTYRSDGIACSLDVPVASLKLLARTMIGAGFEIKAITRVRDPNAKRRLQIISYATDSPVRENIPLTIEEIDALSACPSELIGGGKG